MRIIPNMRHTRQREVVLAAVQATMDHPTADWVFRQARRRLPRISLATVYRNLKELAAQGLINEIHTGSHAARFDGNTGRHYHIRCLGCGRVNDLPMSVDTGIEEEAGRAMNYRVLGHEVEVLGVCPRCEQTEIDSRSHFHHQSERESSPRGARGRRTDEPKEAMK